MAIRFRSKYTKAIKTIIYIHKLYHKEVSVNMNDKQKEQLQQFKERGTLSQAEALVYHELLNMVVVEVKPEVKLEVKSEVEAPKRKKKV